MRTVALIASPGFAGARSNANALRSMIVGSVLFTASAFAQPAEPEPESEQAPSAADPPAVLKDPKVAKKWLQAGDKLIHKGDQLAKAGNPDANVQYENAVTAYQRALEASDDLTILYPLAVALEKSGNTPEAMKQLKRLVITPAIKPDVVKKAQAKLDELAMKVGIVTLQITPDGTTVSLGGKPVGDAPLAEPLVLPPGTHKVSFTAAGFQPRDLDLKVEAGSESERKITLAPVPVVTKLVEKDEGAPPPPAAEPSLVPIYLGGGITIGLGLIAGVTGIIAVSEHGTFTDPMATAAERDGARSSGKTFALVTDFCLVGALGAAVFTGYWYMYKYKPQTERQTLAKVGVAPWVQPEAGGLVVAGSF